jgi:hypothetical protein
MTRQTTSLEEYKDYITSTVAFMEMWQSCYYALLSNPEYSEDQWKSYMNYLGNMQKNLNVPLDNI